MGLRTGKTVWQREVDGLAGGGRRSAAILLPAPVKTAAAAQGGRAQGAGASLGGRRPLGRRRSGVAPVVAAAAGCAGLPAAALVLIAAGLRVVLLAIRTAPRQEGRPPIAALPCTSPGQQGYQQDVV